MKALKTTWVNTCFGSIGIVVAEYDHGPRKVFMLQGNYSSNKDVEQILKDGSELRFEDLEEIYKLIKYGTP